MADEFRLPAATRIGRVHLRVADLERCLRFYRDTLGLMVRVTGPDRVVLTARTGWPILVMLTEDRAATSRLRGATGLYHFAILLPDRRELARVFLRLRDRGWPLQGLSDHAVSEAIYLADPEGNGIELYADRPRERWSREHGELYMTTRPLELADLLTSADNAARGMGLPPQTRMGHIHLQVSDLRAAERFYHQILGFDVTVRRYPGALFFAAGAYHHHMGTNIWNSRGGPSALERAMGLIDFAIELPDAASVARLRERVERAGYAGEEIEDGWLAHDEDGIAILVRPELTPPSTA